MDSIEPNSSVSAVIQARRTIKQFRSDLVPEETLWRILDAARWAPNHRLTEPWRIAIIGTQSREALAHPLASQTASSQDPSVLAKAKENARQNVMSFPVLLAVTCRLAGNPDQQVEDLTAHRQSLHHFNEIACRVLCRQQSQRGTGTHGEPGDRSLKAVLPPYMSSAS